LSTIASSSGGIGQVPALRGSTDPWIGIPLGNLPDCLLQVTYFQMLETSECVEHQLRLVGRSEMWEFIQIATIQELNQDWCCGIASSPGQCQGRIPSHLWHRIFKQTN